MENKGWIKFRKFYSELYHIKNSLVDMIAVYEILLFCASGRSNKTIARFLDMEEDYVSDVLEEFISFRGFEYDLDLNPSSIFDRVENFEEFVNEVKLVSPLSVDTELILWYSVCTRFNSIRERIDKFYESEPRSS